MAATKNRAVQKIEVSVNSAGYAKIKLPTGSVVRVKPDTWRNLQEARLKCRAQHGEIIEASWYYDTLSTLKSEVHCY